jgi:hypothetical protein
MNGETRFCRDCKFLQPHDARLDLSKCGHPQAMKISADFVITGAAATEQMFCSTMRAGYCGAAGLLWEAKFEDVPQ